jgi:hypothetical protein
MTKQPSPSARAILLADQIIVEAGTGKKSLIGIYSNLVAPTLPTRQLLHVYALLVDAAGTYDFDLELAGLETGNVIHRGRMEKVFTPGPGVPIELVMRLPAEFTAYGEYEFRLLHQGRIFAARKLSVMPPPPPPPPKTAGRHRQN